MERVLLIKNIILILLFATIVALTTIYWERGVILYVIPLLISAIFLAIHIITQKLRYIKKLKFLIEAIANKDYTFSFTEPNTGKQNSSNYYLNQIRIMLREARKDLELQEVYFKTILDKINGGVMIATQNNAIILANQAIKKLLQAEVIPHINSLSLQYVGMSEAFLQTQPNAPQTFSFTNEKEEVKISIQLTLWEHNNKVLKVYTINNIAEELNQKELESWSKLTRVLTHEIMNSLTPIITISSKLIEDKNITNRDIKHGLGIIAHTSNSLVEFVDNYRRLSRISPPVMQPIYVKQLLHNSIGLFTSNTNISFSLSLNLDDMLLYADESQIMQVVINLIKNGIESIGNKKGKIRIEALIDEMEIITIKVFDSGDKVSADVAENIFVPFFSTKKQGSGIGLSISKEIMRLHNGSISLFEDNVTKCFILTFK